MPLLKVERARSKGTNEGTVKGDSKTGRGRTVGGNKRDKEGLDCKCHLTPDKRYMHCVARG